MIESGSFGLIQQFGAGAIDLTAAARGGVQVANMPGCSSHDAGVPRVGGPARPRLLVWNISLM
jgi:hypothetical protein